MSDKERNKKHYSSANLAGMAYERHLMLSRDCRLSVVERQRHYEMYAKNAALFDLYMRQRIFI